MSPLLLLISATLAQTSERPVLPFRSLAGEDGAHVLFSNPALLNYDRDAMYGVYFDSAGLEGLNGLTLSTTGGGLGGGLGYRQEGVDGGAWWTISSGASLRLGPQVSFGNALHWQLPDGGDNNFVSWDLGLGWRPAPFLGLGGSVLNLGNPAPELGIYTRYGGGVALRPLGDLMTLGLDYQAVSPPEDTVEHHGVVSLRARPYRGIWLRVYGDQNLTDMSSLEVGAALEVHVASMGVGATGRTLTADQSMAGGGYIVSAPESDQLFNPGKQVADFRFASAYPYSPASSLLSAPEESYLSLLARLKDAAESAEVRGLVLRLDVVPFSIAQIEEIRSILQIARDNNKPVVAMLGLDASTRAYLLASACDRVYLHPAGSLDLVGLSVEMQYFHGLLEMVGVEAQYAKRAEYKAAPEQWTNTGSSGPAREQMDALLDDLYSTIVEGIARGRGKTPEEVRALIDGGPYTGQEALEKGLIDALVYPDALSETLEGVYTDGFTLDESYNLNPDNSGWSPNRAIAVVVVDGVIASGESSSGGLLSGAATGSATVVRQLDHARRADGVKGVVLRVDSPGGSAFASDEIWRAVERVQDAGKPVVVSMGGMAASGGYYVSAGADAILAMPSTITGSIGVFGGKFSAEDLFERLHVSTEEYNRGRNAGMYSLARPFDDVEYAALDHLIADTYRQFKEKVEQGREMTPDAVEAAARGRVWSGLDARDQNLVDNLGGFYDAVELVRQEAGLSPNASCALIVYNPWVGDGTAYSARLLSLFRPQVELPPELSDYLALSALRNEQIYTLLPYRLDVH